MSTEVHDGIGVKSMSGPEICCRIVMRRCGLGAMDHLEIIVAKAGSGLRNQHDVAEPQARESQVAVFVAETLTGKFTVNGVDIAPHFRRE